MTCNWKYIGSSYLALESFAMKIPTRPRIQGAHFCKYCGTKVPKDAVYCPLCGRPSLLLHNLTELILDSL
jgi:rRNA maturation endonuclease Nob1